MKKSVKVLVVSMIAVLAMGALAGCGSKDEGASSDVTTYIAATEPTYAPFDTTDEDGNIVGFDMDLLNAIAEDQGFKVEYKTFEFDAIVPGCQRRQCRHRSGCHERHRKESGTGRLL